MTNPTVPLSPQAPPLDIERDGNRTRIRLGPNKLGLARIGGLFMIVFGSFFSGFATFWMILASGLGQGQFDWARSIFAIFGIPFLFAGLVPLFKGLFLLFPTRTTLTLTADRLTRLERLAFLPSRTSIDVATIKKLALRPSRNPLIAALEVTHLRKTIERTTVLAAGYPQATLQQLADELHREIARLSAVNLLHVGSASPSPLPAVEVVAADDTAANLAELTDRLRKSIPQESDLPLSDTPVEKPANTRVETVPLPNGLMIVKPASKFRGPSLFFLAFATVWTGISLIVFLGFSLALLADPNWLEVAPLCFISLFVAIGLLMFAVGIQLGWSKSVLIATPESIVFSHKGPFRAKEWQASTPDILSIRTTPSGTTINDKPLMEVHIKTRGRDEPYKCFAGLNDQEIEWLADAMRRAAGLSSPEPTRRKSPSSTQEENQDNQETNPQ